jgi:Lecithin:cholesterol acyltransferase
MCIQRDVGKEMTAATGRSVRPGAAANLPRMYPMNTPLPNAPRMRLYCGYGHGLPTERAYHYRYDSSGLEPDQCPAAKLESNPKISMGQVWNFATEVVVVTAPEGMFESNGG